MSAPVPMLLIPTGQSGGVPVDATHTPTVALQNNTEHGDPDVLQLSIPEEDNTSDLKLSTVNIVSAEKQPGKSGQGL